MASTSEGQLPPVVTPWPVIIHHSMLKTEYETIFRQKQLKVRVSNGVIPGSVVFPLSSVAFLIVPVSRATTLDPENNIQLSQELIERVDNFLKVHKNCYMLCQAPLHGQNEKQVFAMIQRMYLNTRLNMIPVHNAMEGVKTMFTIAKGLCKPVSDILNERLEQVVKEQKKSDFMTAALKQLGLTNHECQVIEDSLGSLRNLATASREDLLNCSLDSNTVDKLLQFFN
ncbi:protein SPO16 homolog [Ruditapes philippinarum]|uniref:protein SPO16 homolog n=1 Tax=Ruditapes philippinarum TaxID=129788 RepID=UPI00295C0481|nr:protein SPO16 homolog [Ruditapes philippinarum]